MFVCRTNGWWIQHRDHLLLITLSQPLREALFMFSLRTFGDALLELAECKWQISNFKTTVQHCQDSEASRCWYIMRRHIVSSMFTTALSSASLGLCSFDSRPPLKDSLDHFHLSHFRIFIQYQKMHESRFESRSKVVLKPEKNLSSTSSQASANSSSAVLRSIVSFPSWEQGKTLLSLETKIICTSSYSNGSKQHVQNMHK